MPAAGFLQSYPRPMEHPSLLSPAQGFGEPWLLWFLTKSRMQLQLPRLHTNLRLFALLLPLLASLQRNFQQNVFPNGILHSWGFCLSGKRRTGSDESCLKMLLSVVFHSLCLEHPPECLLSPDTARESFALTHHSHT